ncbi:MAG TPA: hypothetical protein EYQ14_25790 [Gammaproteobacteria bacterium]|nr:hypothetical protein [Gammaproteobacteria bacterium]
MQVTLTIPTVSVSGISNKTRAFIKAKLKRKPSVNVDAMHIQILRQAAAIDGLMSEIEQLKTEVASPLVKSGEYNPTYDEACAAIEARSMAQVRREHPNLR